MKSNDEDLDLFLEEFGKLLRKYHYDISPFTLRRIATDDVVLGGFAARNGDGVISPEYFKATPEILKIIEEDENEHI
jgi:DNA-directed RNA polymerase subunit H (RpoH/RPB5)